MRFVHRAILLVVLVVVVAPIASAQRGGGGGRRRGGGDNQNQSAEDAPAMPARPAPGVAALVLEHASDFALADSQRVLLESIRHTQDSANRPWIQQLDSLRPHGQPANGPNDLSQEQRDEIDARRKAISTVMEGMRDNNALARQRTMAVLSPDQQVKAAKLEEDARKKAEEARKSRSGDSSAGGGRRGGGGMGGGMGRPPEG
jgi:uncharacterized membrane protein YgcG